MRKPSVRRIASHELAAFEARGPVLVLFTADWSPMDRKLDPIIEEVARRAASTVAIVEMDVDARDTADLPMRYGVTSVPTLVLLVHGTVIDRHVGLGTAAAIEHWLKERLAGDPRLHLAHRSGQATEAQQIRQVETDPAHEIATDVALRRPVTPDAPRERVPLSAAPERSVHILFLAANPSDVTRLALTREVEEIDHRLQSTRHSKIYDLAQHWEVEASKVPGLILRHKPQIVHFSGHGTPDGELIFQDATGASAPASVVAIAEIFAILNKYVRCVVLNACFSRAQADAIVQSVDVVIGMPGSVPDGAAIAFAAAFYEALGYGEDIKTAFELGCNAIRFDRAATGSAMRDAETAAGGVSPAVQNRPVLLTRAGVDPAGVWFTHRG